MDRRGLVLLLLCNKTSTEFSPSSQIKGSSLFSAAGCEIWLYFSSHAPSMHTNLTAPTINHGVCARVWVSVWLCVVSPLAAAVYIFQFPARSVVFLNFGCSSRLVLCKSCSPHSRAESREDEPGGHRRARRDEEGGDGRQLSHLKEQSAKPTFSYFVCFWFHCTALSHCRPVPSVLTDLLFAPQTRQSRAKYVNNTEKIPIKLAVDIMTCL